MEKIIHDLILLDESEKIEIKNLLPNIYVTDCNSKGLSIDRLCGKCKKIKTFIIEITECFGLEAFSSQLKEISQKIARNLEDRLVEQFKKIHGIIILCFYCPTCSEKIFSLYEYKDGYMYKLLEIPEVSKTENYYLKKYSILKSNFSYVQELATAFKLHSKHAEIGAFIYLRRCLENYINSLLKEEDLEKNLKFQDKIELVKEQIAEEVYPCLSNLYSILSKSVHELSEDECKDFFNILFKSITVLLDQAVEKIKRKKDSDDLVKEINRIKSQIS